MDATIYSEARAYTAQKGIITGGVWITSFASFIGGLSQPGLGFLSMLLGISSIFVTGSLVKRFRYKTTDFGFGMAWWMSLQIFVYASLLMAAAQFIYFRFMDQGFVADSYAALMQQPDVIKAMKDMGYGDNYSELIEQALDIWRTTTPIQLTFNFLISNFFLGTILSIPAAIIGCLGKVPDTNSINK